MKPTCLLISYLRVSTDGQGERGLGMQAQREAVARYHERSGCELVCEYVEVESGKRADRPKLDLALAHAKRIGATLVFAKLDRLARNQHFLMGLHEAGVPMAFCDFPDIPPNAMGKFLLQLMAGVAELEAGMISERTRAALARARANGKALGGHRGELAAARSAAALAVKANEAAERLRDTVTVIRASGATTAYAVARELTKRRARTPRGGSKWQAGQAAALMVRLGLSS